MSLLPNQGSWPTSALMFASFPVWYDRKTACFRQGRVAPLPNAQRGLYDRSPSRLDHAYVQQHGQPGLVLVNDLQSLRSGKQGLTGLASAVDIMADMRAISKICDAPLVLFSQLAEGKGISQAIREQADRVVTVQMANE